MQHSEELAVIGGADSGESATCPYLHLSPENFTVNIDQFDFDLPESLIAQQPVEPRDSCRLMVLNRANQSWSHHIFSELPDLLRSGDLIVRNNTQVVPARLTGTRDRTGGHWECLILSLESHPDWLAITQTRGKPRPGETVTVGKGLQLELVENRQAGQWIVRPLNIQGEKTGDQILEEHGHIPLPHYIRQGNDQPMDREWYQTVFAKESGSVAAPTAGLHFTPELNQTLYRKGIHSAEVTLHVGIGTFQPIRVSNVMEHRLHAEVAQIDETTIQKIRETKQQGGRVVAVGTTSTRTLETAALGGKLKAFHGPTDLYITPGFRFQVTDAMITNFHLPKSSLMVLISALAGREFVLNAYAEAIRTGYRFYSYGDAMLIL
ncbi:MAG: hypothetical protein RJA81_394 [Planctomycetota bacterium]